MWRVLVSKFHKIRLNPIFVTPVMIKTLRGGRKLIVYWLPLSRILTFIKCLILWRANDWWSPWDYEWDIHVFMTVLLTKISRKLASASRTLVENFSLLLRNFWVVFRQDFGLMILYVVKLYVYDKLGLKSRIFID